MFRFLLSFGAVWGVLLAWGVYAEPTPFGVQPGELGTGRLAALLPGVPCLGAFVAAELLEWFRPRRIFDPRVHRSWTPVFAGLGAGLLSVLFATPMIVWLDDKAPDGVLLAGAAAIGAAFVLLFLR